MYSSGCLTTSLWLSIIYFRETQSSYWELQIILYSEPRLCSRISFLNLELTSKYRECLANEVFVWIYAFYKMLSTEYSGHFRIIKSLTSCAAREFQPKLPSSKHAYPGECGGCEEKEKELRNHDCWDSPVMCEGGAGLWVMNVAGNSLSGTLSLTDWAGLSSWLTSARPGLDQASTTRTLTRHR